jgi:uncharacterized protein YlxW (UPF0749 family)
MTAHAAGERSLRSRLVVGLLCFVLGFALVLQVRSTRDDSGLRNARQSDLVGILDDLNARSDRLQRELVDLEADRQRLAGGKDNAKVALQQAQQREQTLGILAGTLPAHGPGIELTVIDESGAVQARTLLDAVQELRDAGAEAMQINDVRVVADTALTDTGGGISVGGRPVNAPYGFRVIGDPATMATALEIRGGVLEQLREQGARGSVRQRTSVTVDALRAVRAARYARPSDGQEG